MAFIILTARFVALRMESKNLTDKYISLITKSCCNLKELSLAGCQKLTVDGVKAVVENCPFIEDLSIPNTLVRESCELHHALLDVALECAFNMAAIVPVGCALSPYRTRGRTWSGKSGGFGATVHAVV